MLMRNLKSSCFLFSLCISFIAFSAPQHVFNGYYAGGQFGTSFAHGTQQINGGIDAGLFNNGLSTNIPLSLSDSLSRNAMIGSVLAGYGWTKDKLYLGGEAVLSESYYKMINNVNIGLVQNFTGLVNIGGAANINTQVNISPVQFGLLFRPGLLLTPTTLLFGRVGASVATVHYTVETVALSSLKLSDGISTDQLIIPANVQASTSVLRTVFQLGTGLEQMINEHWTVRFDYLYSYYGNMQVNSNQLFNANATIEGIDVPGSFLISGLNKVHNIYDQSVTFGISYHFNKL